MAAPSVAHARNVDGDASDRCSISVLHRGRTHVIDLPDRSAETLLRALRQLVGDDQARVRVVHKGRKIEPTSDGGLIELEDGAKVGLIVSRAEDVASLEAKEADDRRREEVLRTRKTVAVRRVLLDLADASAPIDQHLRQHRDAAKCARRSLRSYHAVSRGSHYAVARLASQDARETIDRSGDCRGLQRARLSRRRAVRYGRPCVCILTL